MSKQRLGDTGFSLVEVLVTMLLFGILAVAMLPLMLTGAKASDTNRMLIGGITDVQFEDQKLRAFYPSDPQLVGMLIDDAGSVMPMPAQSCLELHRGAGSMLSIIKYNRGRSGGHYTPVDVRAEVGPCPSSYPGTVSVRFTVHRVERGEGYYDPHSEQPALLTVDTVYRVLSYDAQASR